MVLEKIRECVKLTRLKAMGVSTIAVFGALSVNGTLELWHFIALFIIGIAFNMLGFVLNDIVDFEIDKKSKELSERPLVKGTISKKSAEIIILTCYILIFVLAIFLFRNILALLILSLSVLLGTTYDCFGKRFLGSDFILAASIAFFCLFGASTISNRFEDFTIVIVTIIFINVLFFNIIEGGFKDVNNDRKTSAKTTAVFLGVEASPEIHIPKTFKTLAITILSTLAFLVFSSFVIIQDVYNFRYWYIQFFILFILITSLFISMFKMLNLKSFDRRKVRLIITWQEIKRYIVVAVLLVSTAGILWSVTLILIPIIWYLFFAFVILEKSFRTSKML
jgi:4-hydroxybenzoate polyprenyltransferase